MAEASGHDKQMEDLMGTEIPVSGIEERKLQRIDDAADGVDDAAGNTPEESGCGLPPDIPVWFAEDADSDSSVISCASI